MRYESPQVKAHPSSRRRLSYSVKVEVEDLEDLLGPDVDVDRILKEARDERGLETFETFTTNGLSEFLVASRQKKMERRQNSSASASEGWWQEGKERQRVGWSSVEKKVVGAVEDYLDNCVHTKVGIEDLERLMVPENPEVSLRYVLK